MAKDYVYVREWVKFTHGFGYYANQQVQRAKETNAPADAIYEQYSHAGPTGAWVRFAQLSENHEFRKEMKEKGLCPTT